MLVTAIDGGLDASLTASGRERQKAAAGTGAAAGTEGDQGESRSVCDHLVDDCFSHVMSFLVILQIFRFMILIVYTMW